MQRLPKTEPGAAAAAIADEAGSLLRRFTGRGPSRARAYITDDVVTVVLEDSATEAERTLVRRGDTDLVLAARASIQAAMHADLRACVERVLNREVRGFVSSNAVDPDVRVETFLLTSDDPAAGLAGPIV